MNLYLVSIAKREVARVIRAETGEKATAFARKIYRNIELQTEDIETNLLDKDGAEGLVCVIYGESEFPSRK